MSTLESVAADRGLPATLLGYTPDERFYWYEPYMNHLNDYEDPAKRAEALATYTLFGVKGEAMAPRFKEGTWVAALPVTRRQDMVPGVYAGQWQDADGIEQHFIGRLERVAYGWLTLRHDKTGELIRRRLRWNDPSFRLYRVTHYVKYMIT